MSRRTLLLNADNQPLTFISERKLWKLMYKDKVEIINDWNKSIIWKSQRINHPSVVRMKYYIYYYAMKNHFSRKVLILRDSSTCQYCSKTLSQHQITIDHVVPRERGGRTSYTNCVVACYACNNKKANRLLEETNFKLLKPPMAPAAIPAFSSIELKDVWHDSWNSYLNIS